MAGGENWVTLYPVGGLGEIGQNCMLLESRDSAILIDCGLMFPEDFHYGIDVLIPRLDFLLEKKDKIAGIILTHAHEDHIGALPWLLKDMNAPLYGSEFTLTMVQNKLRDGSLVNAEDVAFHMVQPRDEMRIGDFTLHFFPVCHSIIQGYALGMETPVGRILHTGDFKIDQNPLGGHFTDLEGIGAFAESGVRMMLSDSTNVEREGRAMTELEVKDTLRDIFTQAEGRVVMTLFSSHVQRIQEIADLATQFGRKIAVSGRSLLNTIDVARRLGLLNVSGDVFCELSELRDTPDRDVVLLVTGSQGEPMSALTRLAEGSHRQLRIHRGDTVIMSSRFIPGNTKAINKVINSLYRLGAEVMYEKVQAVHASGHAHREELETMLRTVRPTFFVPVHGEYRHLIKHSRLARENGVAEERALVLENGQPLTLFEKGIRFEEQFSANSVMVDGKGVGDVGRSILKERRLLAGEGMVILLLVLDSESGEILMGPKIQSKGFIFEQEYAHILEEAESIVLDVYAQVSSTDWKKLRQRSKAALRRYFQRSLDRDPVIVPLVINV
ncbi:MAG: ribonuclease J [Desulfohalobiaceae bacterium]|nr:ribonuclease J [Desulfohalobiaceae bacterium]